MLSNLQTMREAPGESLHSVYIIKNILICQLMSVINGDKQLPVYCLAQIIETRTLVALLHLTVTFQDTFLTSMTHKALRTVSGSRVK